MPRGHGTRIRRLSLDFADLGRAVMVERRRKPRTSTPRRDEYEARERDSLAQCERLLAEMRERERPPFRRCPLCLGMEAVATPHQHGRAANMPAPMYSLRAMRLVDGEWENVEVASAPDRRTAMARADAYSRTGTAVYVHKLQPPTTFWASSPDDIVSSREERGTP